MRTSHGRRSPGSKARRERWRIGVDLGGTWVRVVAVDSQSRHREVTRPSPGLAGLPEFLRRLWQRWALARGDVESLVVASRGVWTRAERRGQRQRLRAAALQVTVMSDAEAAHLGALGGAAGILLLAGTGSMALGRDVRGRWARAGGWGPLLGDEGSAFWIGREWLRATMSTTSFRRARTMLASPDPVARIAALAPGVLRSAHRGLPEARRIVARGQAALAELLVRVSRELRLGPPVTVSWSGGLIEDPRFRAGVWHAARRAGLAVTPSVPRASAATAVGTMAQRLGGKRAAHVNRPRAPLQRHPAQ